MTATTLMIDAINAFSDNYIWLITHPDSYGAFIVDPGDAAPVRKVLEARQLQLAGILVTHHHADHTGGVAELTETGNITVYGPANSAIKGITHALHDQDHVTILGHEFSVLSVPGHTLDHIAYFHHGDQPVLFCGDTLFSAGCGRLFEGTPRQMSESLNKFKQLPDKTKVYCAHEYTSGNLKFAQAVEPKNKIIRDYIEEVNALRQAEKATIPSSIEREKQINPFLRTEHPDVVSAAKKRGPDQSLTENSVCHDVLRVIREWKDNF